MKYLAIACLLISHTYSITPSKNGPIPPEVLDNFNRQNIGFEYGNSGWVKKLKNQNNPENRNVQLELNIPILLGKY